MVIKRICWNLVFIVFLTTGFSASAQTPPVVDTGEKKETFPLPEPASLKPNWWKYFDVDSTVLNERVTTVTDQLSKIQNQSPELNDKVNQGLLQQLKINLKSLVNLKTRKAQPKPKPHSIKGKYTLEDWLKLSNEVEKGEVEAKIIQEEIDRTEDLIKTAKRALDTLMAAYLEIKNGDPGRYPKGLEIMTQWASLAVAEEKNALAKENLESLQIQIADLNSQTKVASQKLIASPKDSERLEIEVERTTKKLEQSRKRLEKAQIEAASSFGETPVDKALARFKEQAVIQASLTVALGHTELVTNNVEKHIYLVLTRKDGPDPQKIVGNLAEWKSFASELNQKKDLWRTAALTEKNLVQNLLGTEPDKTTDRELERINLNRSKLSEEILNSLHRLDKAIQNLELLMKLLTEQLPNISGNVQTWWIKSKQGVINFVDLASSWLTMSLFKVNETPVTTLGLLRFLMIFWVALLVSRFVGRSLGRYMESRGEQDVSGIYTLSRLIHYGIIGVGTFIALASIGLDLSNLALVAGALSLGIGFGLQSVVNNFVSGLLLLFERNIKIGDFIEITNGVTGIVKEINVRTTLINTNDNIDIILPNSELVGSSVINWTLREALRRMHIPFGVAYGSDKELVRKAVLEAADQVPYTYKGKKSREPQVWLIEFGDSSLNFELIVWISPEMVRKPAAVHAQYTWEIESALRKYDIEIPFPQRDLHLKSGFENLIKPTKTS